MSSDDIHYPITRASAEENQEIFNEAELTVSQARVVIVKDGPLAGPSICWGD